jgi:hypothetical protein
MKRRYERMMYGKSNTVVPKSWDDMERTVREMRLKAREAAQNTYDDYAGIDIFLHDSGSMAIGGSRIC